MSKKTRLKAAQPAPATPAAQKPAPDAPKAPAPGVAQEREEKAFAAESRTALAAKTTPVTRLPATPVVPEAKPAVVTGVKAVVAEAPKPLAVTKMASPSPAPATAAAAPGAPQKADGKTSPGTMAAKPAPVPARRTVDVPFELEEPSARQVSLCGAFNDWSPGATPMKRQPDGCWKAIVALPPGHHQYKFVVDGQWRPDPKAKENAYNQYGTFNSVIEVRI